MKSSNTTTTRTHEAIHYDGITVFRGRNKKRDDGEVVREYCWVDIFTLNMFGAVTIDLNRYNVRNLILRQYTSELTVIVGNMKVNLPLILLLFTTTGNLEGLILFFLLSIKVIVLGLGEVKYNLVTTI